MAEINPKIPAILSVKEENSQADVAYARALVNELFKEKAARQRGLLLSIAEQKISTLSRITNIADQVTASIEEDIEELQYYSLDEKIKLLSDLVRSSALISTSTNFVKDMIDSLNDFKNGLDNRGGLSPAGKASVELVIARLKASLD